MKKHTISLVLSILILGSVVSVAQAASWSNQGSKAARQNEHETLRTQTKDMRDQILTEREKLRDAFKAGETEAAQKLGNLHALSLETRFGFYFKRFSGILARLDLAIKDAEKEFGVAKLATSRSYWTQADAKLKSAKTLGDEAIAAFKAIKLDSVKDAKVSLTSAKEKTKAAIVAYKEATRLMKQSSSTLKEFLRANRPSPSPKPSKSPKPSVSPRASDDVKAIPDSRRNYKKLGTPVPVVPPPIN